MKDYEHVVVWLDYFNRNLKRRQGRKVNRDKASGKHDKYIGYGDDRDPEFKMVL